MCDKIIWNSEEAIRTKLTENYIYWLLQSFTGQNQLSTEQAIQRSEGKTINIIWSQDGQFLFPIYTWANAVGTKNSTYNIYKLQKFIHINTHEWLSNNKFSFNIIKNKSKGRRI